MKYLRPVEVLWVDSQSSNTWQSVDAKIRDAENASLTCRSVGMFVKKTKDRIIIAQSVALDNAHEAFSMSDTLSIPIEAVKEINKLKGEKE